MQFKHIKHNKANMKKLCNIMGEDFDSPACREMMDHINSCPNCKIYYDTVKKTVLLCKENDCAEKLPEEVNHRLLKILDLQDLGKQKG